MRQNKKEVKKMKISEADLFEKIEAFLADYPICQYGFLKSEDILFSDKVRYICEKECPRYGKSWSCPPAVGEVADCKKHCISYQYALVFTTLSEVKDIDDMEETLATRSMKRLSTRSVRNWSSYPKHTLLFLPNPVQSAASVHTLKVAAIRNI